MVTPANNSVNLYNIPPSNMVLLRPLIEVINTKEKINAIKEKYIKEIKADKELTILGYKWDIVLGSLGTLLVLGSTIQEKLPLLIAGMFISIVAGSNYRNQARYEKIIQNLNNEKFVNWAESKQIKLTFSNIEKVNYYFNQISDCNERIARLNLDVSA